MSGSGLPFDRNDPAVRRWLADLNVTLDDLHAVVKDMQRKKRRRDLGPRKHRALFRESWDKLTAILGRTLPEPPEPQGGGAPH
ncbi:MAG: hypothetical protein QM820_43155 [Minicystis sp.]